MHQKLQLQNFKNIQIESNLRKLHQNMQKLTLTFLSETCGRSLICDPPHASLRVIMEPIVSLLDVINVLWFDLRWRSLATVIKIKIAKCRQHLW